MKKFSSFFLATLLAVSVVVSLTAVSAGAAEEKKEQKQTVSPKVGKPLQEAVALMSKRQYEEALTKVNEARAVPNKTEFEELAIDQYAASALLGLRRYADAAAMHEKILDSGSLTPEKAEAENKMLIQLYVQTRNIAKLEEYVPKWLKTHPNDVEMQEIYAQVQFNAGQLKQAKETIESLISSAEKSGQRPKEKWLNDVVSISYKMAGGKIDKSTMSAIQKALHYYPTPTLWQNLLAGMKDDLSNNDEVSFQLYRLMLALGVLKSGDDYTELAQLANHFGFPAEGVNVMQAGFDAKALGVGETKEQDVRKLAWMKKNMEADKAELPNEEKRAAQSSTGQEDVLLGEDYIGYGRFADAIEAIESGLKKGGVKNPDQAQMALGIAYYNNKQKDQARAAFKKVPESSDLKRIADLWILHIG
ncbi:MAG TPA: tetratricopeptide repeat protein [Steroidobacteraceae bacterium]|nr:tetratricopeptide repeat protein [Steroidobacteraceae bacterium]